MRMTLGGDIAITSCKHVAHIRRDTSKSPRHHQHRDVRPQWHLGHRSMEQLRISCLVKQVKAYTRSTRLV